MARKNIIKNQKLLPFIKRRRILASDAAKRKGGKIVSTEEGGYKGADLKKFVKNPEKTWSPWYPPSNTKKAVWLQGPTRLGDSGANFRKNLDKIIKDVRSQYSDDQVEFWYGGYSKSDSDQIIGDVAKQYGLKTRAISPFSKDKEGNFLFPGKTQEDKLDAREQALRKLEDRGVKGGKEGRQLLNRYYFDSKGEVGYSFGERSKWWDRYSQLQEKHGKGNTAKIVQEYLDEVEDEIRGVSRQDPSEYRVIQQTKYGPKSEKQWRITKKIGTGSILDKGQTRSYIKKPNLTSGLAALDVIREKHEFNIQSAKDYNEHLINDGLWIDPEKPVLGYTKEEAIAFNKESLKKNKFNKPRHTRGILNQTELKRIANLSGEVGYPLKTDQALRVDFPDSPGEEHGKEFIEEDTSDIRRQQPYSVKKGRYIDQRTEEVLPGHEVVKLNKQNPKLIQNIVSDLVNKQQESGYSGANLYDKSNPFYEHFVTPKVEAEKAKLYEGKEGTLGTHTEKPKLQEVKVEQVESAIKEQGKRDAEIDEVDALKRRTIAARNLTHFYSGEKREFFSRTLINEYAKIPDMDAPSQQSVLNAAWTKDANKKKESAGKVIGKDTKKTVSEWDPFDRKLSGEATGGEKREDTRKAKISRKDIGINIRKVGEITGHGTMDRTNKKLVGGIIRHGAIQETLPHHLDPSKNVTDHRPGAGNRYTTVPSEGEKVVPHIKPGERGILSRAYVSNPSQYTGGSKTNVNLGETKRVGTGDKFVRKIKTTLGRHPGVFTKVNKSSTTGKTGYSLPKNINKIIKQVPQEGGRTGIIKMTQSKRTGTWGTAQQHRKEALKLLKNKAGKNVTKSLGPLSIISMISGVLKSRNELKKAGVKDPSTLETLSQMYIPKSGFQIKQYEERKKLAKAI
jgi:hypothetical protein